MNTYPLTNIEISKDYSLLKRSIGIVSFTFLTFIGAKIEILVEPVPFTLQTLFVILTGAFLGKKDAFISQMFYLFLGAVGIPVFAGPVSSFMKIIGPTGGYLLAFPIAAFISGWILENNKNISGTIIAVFTGMFIIFACGVSFLNIFYLNDIEKAISLGLGVFSFWEIVKIIVAIFIIKELRK